MDKRMTNEIREVALSDYPPTLRNMPSPPPRLYVRGCFPAPESATQALDIQASDIAERKYVCVVGSRKWTPYGRDAIKKIIGGLTGYPISIVSGLAIGIDSIAHAAALEARLHCVAFPGSSLEWDKIYPPAHLDLAKRIVDSGGALVSCWDGEYPMGKWAFPARNRLMAGLSHAVLIVEAARRSGSLLTAKHAEDFSRDVYAVPGAIDTSQSYGPHMLIRRGAALVDSAEDVLRELGFDATRGAPNSAGAGNMTNANELNLDKISAAILKMISREHLSIDVLVNRLQRGRSKITVSEINQKISSLEMDGLIAIDAGIIRPV